MVKLEYAKDPRWADPEHTMIDLTTKWSHLCEEVPFTASASDPQPHGRDVFDAAAAGQFGVVAEFVPPPQPDVLPQPESTGADEL